MLSTINGHFEVQGRKFALQSRNDRDDRIAGVRNAEDDLKLRVLLIAKRVQAGIGFRFHAAQGFQYRHGSRGASNSHRIGNRLAGGPPRDEAIECREGREQVPAVNDAQVVDGTATRCINTAPLKPRIFSRIAMGSARKMKPYGKSQG